MNYIELINQFWRLNEEHSFTTSEVAVYFYLLNTSNRLAWKNPFNQSNGYIINALNISEPTLIRVRNSLKQFGLIDFKSDKGRKHQTIYTLKYLNGFSNTVSIPALDGPKTLNDFSNTVSNTISNTDSIPVSNPIENALDNIKHKLNETKQDDEEDAATAGPVPEPGTNPGPSPPPPGPAPPPSPHLFKEVEQLKEECLQDRMFYEPLCMRLHLEITWLSGWLDAFNRELQFRGENRKLPKDYRKHFADWIKYKDLETDPAQYSPVPVPKNDDKRNNETGSGKHTVAGKQSAGRSFLADRLREKIDKH